jgi:hypothetical protein
MPIKRCFVLHVRCDVIRDYTPLAEEIAASFSEQGFSIRRPVSLEPLVADAGLFERQLPADVFDWFECLGGDRLVTGSGVHGFVPVSVEFAVEWRRAVRASAITLEDAFIGEAFVLIMLDQIGSSFLAFLPLREFGECEFGEYFVKTFDSEEMVSTNMNFGLHFFFWPANRGPGRRLPACLGEIWEEEENT